jgi:hypothetical protein
LGQAVPGPGGKAGTRLACRGGGPPPPCALAEGTSKYPAKFPPPGPGHFFRLWPPCPPCRPRLTIASAPQAPACQARPAPLARAALSGALDGPRQSDTARGGPRDRGWPVPKATPRPPRGSLPASPAPIMEPVPARPWQALCPPGHFFPYVPLGSQSSVILRPPCRQSRIRRSETAAPSPEALRQPLAEVVRPALPWPGHTGTSKNGTLPYLLRWCPASFQTERPATSR